MKTIAFFGGSNAAGAGWLEGKNSPYIYPSLLETKGYNIVNLGRCGENNADMFFESLKFITTQSPSAIVIEWNNFLRFRFSMSPDHDLFISAAGISLPSDFNHCSPITESQVKPLQKLLVQLTHEYSLISTLLDYCLIVEKICKLTNTKVIMLNGMKPSWPKDLFTHYTSNDNLELSLSEYTKDLVDFDKRSDAQIIELIDNLANRFELLDLTNWIYPFDGIPVVDLAPDQSHFGPKTHANIATEIYNLLLNK